MSAGRDSNRRHRAVTAWLYDAAAIVGANYRTERRHCRRSNIVGKPMAQLLLKESCTVTSPIQKAEPSGSVRTADILVPPWAGRDDTWGVDQTGAIVIDVASPRYG